MRSRAVFAAIGAAACSVAVDRLLARVAAAGRARWLGDGLSVRVEVDVEAPPEACWAVLSDLEGQTRWMHDAKAIRVLTPGPAGVGTRAEADVRIFGLGSTDEIEITEWDPPRRFAIGHIGAFKGDGRFTVEAAPGGGTHIVWVERLVAPVLPYLFAVPARPVFRLIFGADLRRFARLVEEEASPTARASPTRP